MGNVWVKGGDAEQKAMIRHSTREYLCKISMVAALRVCRPKPLKLNVDVLAVL